MPHDHIRHVMNYVSQKEATWSARELFFLVKKFFPTETRSRISVGVAELCNCGEFSIHGRRYKSVALKPMKAREEVVACVK